MTELTSPAPSTAGWKEGLDILALARYMKELGGTSVGALGISLGGSSVLNACDEEDSAVVLDGGILAVSPPAVPKLAWERLSEPVPRSHPLYPIHRAFEAALISRVRSGRWPPEAEDMLRVLEHVTAPYYKVDAEEIWTRARGIDHVPGLQGAAARPPSRERSDRQGRAREDAAAGGQRQRPRSASGSFPPARTACSRPPIRAGPTRSTGPSSSAGGPTPNAPAVRPTAEAPELVYSSQDPG